ncbi:MAG TPA: hypothetical protein VFS20_05210 [Longimicrobium sp.]|nr:hypothetical protein [Longimicrobium sp.]
MGFTAEHVPELIRMMLDEELEAGDEDEEATYGPIHAWRTLGLLRAEAAVEPLMRMLEMDSDWIKEEIPAVLGMIGPAAFEPLRAALARWSLDSEPWQAGAAASGLVEIAQYHPEMRDAAVDALSRQLRWWARHHPDLNTMLISDLVQLRAVEAAPLMEAAFAADAVDTSFADDWEDVQVALGLLPERITPRPKHVFRSRLYSTPDARDTRPRPSRPQAPPQGREGRPPAQPQAAVAGRDIGCGCEGDKGVVLSLSFPALLCVNPSG